jgi:hypothetical protein
MSTSPKSITLDLDGKSVVVHRLNYKAARPFLKQLAAVAGALYKDVTPDASPRGFVFAKLPEIVASSDELITALCVGSTNLTAEDFGNLDTISALELLKTAMAVNFDEAFITAAKNFVTSVSATFSVLTV